MKFQPKIYHLLFLFVLLLTSCEDEATQLNVPNAVETFTSNSTLSNLMLRTSSNSTSDDDVLDDTSCFSVELPVTVVLGNITITIENEDGLDELEELLESFEDEIPEFVFPITVISADYTETIIENEEQLDAIIENCISEDNIECVDFEYPISFSEFNTQFVVINTVTINSNIELYAYLESLEDDDTNLVALNFPVTLLFANGETLDVNSNIELSDAISAVDNDCEIDDVENCDAEQIRQSLKECVWDFDDEFNDFDNLTATFNEDFTLEINGPGLNEPITGVWEIIENSDNGNIHLFISELSALSDNLAGDWLIIECDDDELTIQKNDFILGLDQDCDTDNDLDCSPEDLANDLKECLWFANSELLGNEAIILTFNANGGVSVIENNQFVTIGSWIIGVLNTDLQLVLDIEGNYQELSGVWAITVCQDGFYSFVDEDGEVLMLEQDCNSNEVFECFDNLVFELTECANNVGEAEFNLQESVLNEVGCDADFNATFHLMQSDADNNVNPIPNIENYSTTTAQLFLRVENVAGEFQIYTIFLNAIDCDLFECFESFDAVLEQCDDNNDGTEIFNLPIAFDNCTPTADVVTYHNSLSDAETNANAISNPESYVSNNPIETIYVRVEIGNQVEIFELLIKIEDCTIASCTEEDVDAILMSCEWKITEYNGDDHLQNFIFIFDTNNQMLVTNSDNNQSDIGVWTTATNNEGNVVVTFDGADALNIQDIWGNWEIVECTDEQLIFNMGDTQMTFDKLCD